MKHTLTFLSIFLIIASSFAQVPQNMSYQAAVKNTSGVLISNTEIGIQVSILQGSPDGPEIYKEAHKAVTGSEGLTTLSIGKGINPQGDFSMIDWADGLHFIKTTIDPRGGSNYNMNGNCELFTPYSSKAGHLEMASLKEFTEVGNKQGIPETNVSSNALTSRMDDVICDLNTYQSATIIAPTDFPYTSPGSGVTVSAATNTSLLNNVAYSCGPNSFACSPMAWWINNPGHFITLTFSQPVTNFSVVVNGSNSGEVFSFTATTGTIDLLNYCSSGFTVGGNANELLCTLSGTTGTLITVNNPVGSTQYTIMHNGAGQGSRISLLDCFAAGPSVDPVSNIEVCAGTTIPGIDFTGTEDATFNWTNDNPGIGLASSGIGDIPAFLAIGSSTTQIANLSVTATLNGETSEPVLFTIRVNPTPNVNGVASQEICNNNSSDAITFSGLVPGTVYNWTNNTPSIGLAASGSGNIPSFTAVNSGTSPITATIIVTPTFTAGQSTCDGSPVSFTITVNPPLTIDPISNQTVCNNGSSAPVVFTGSIPGTTFNWTNNTPSIGLAASGSGDIPSFTALNAGTASVTANITVSANGSNGKAYIPNKDSDNVSVIDLATNTVITTINVGDSPYSACVIPDGSRVYVVNYGSNNISIINTSTNTVTGTIPVSGAPIAINSSPDGSRVYVTRTNANALSVINTATNTEVASIAVGNGPYCPAVSPDGSRLYVTNQFSATVSVINTATNTLVTTIPTGTNLSGACVSPDGSKVYVTGITANSVSVINTASNVVESVISGVSNPIDICVSPDGNTAYVSSRNVNMITVINTITNTVIATIPGFNFPNGLKLNVDGSLLYVANTSSNNIKIVNTATNSIIGTVAVGAAPWGLYGNFVQSPPEICSGTPQTFTITVNPTPNAIATPSSQTICSGNAISTISLTSGVSGTSFAWTRDNTANLTGIAASGNGNISGALTNSTTSPVTVTFTITPTANGCVGPTTTATVLVNPTPNAVATPASQTICSASSITTIVLSGAIGGTTYNWTRDNTATVTGIAASGSGNITGTLTNTTSAPVTVTFTITPTANGCTGPSTTATVLVNPTPNAVATPASQTICSASSINTIVLSGAVSGTTYAWTRDNSGAVTGIAASGSGNISGTLTNTTTIPVLVTFTITPGANGCTGAAITATVLVNPTPTYTFTSNGLPYSEGDTITACNQDVLAMSVTGPQSLNYTFTRLSNGNVIQSGTTPAAFNYTATNAREGFYEISVINALGCNLKDTVYLLVNALPNPTATATPNPICQGGNLQLGVNGNNNFDFAWSGPNGFTSDIKNPLISGITTAGTGIYTVTVTNLNGCSDTSLISVLVNPTPTAIATPASQTICSATSITTVVLTGTVSGTTYSWTRNNTATVTGIAAAGSGNISGTLTNTTNAPVLVTFTVTPSANGCAGPTTTATVLVNPTPNAVATPAAQTICSGGAISAIVLTGSVTGTTYTWTRNNTATVTGIAASGSGNISGTLTNTTNAPVLVTFTVTPTANGCTGAAITATVLVNPTSNVIATPASQAICSGTSITTIVLSGAVSGTTYSWTRNNTATVTGIAASGSGNISGALTNTTNAPVTVTFTITPSANTCTGTPVTATVVVNPLPVGTISIAPNPACVGSTVQLSATGGSTYSWSGPQGWTSSVQNPTVLLVNHLQGGKYTVTITSSAGCSVIKFAELTVFYPPVATATYETSTACTGSTLVLHGTGAGSYAWTGPAGFTSNKQNPEIPSVTAANSGVYTLVVTSPNGCTAMTTVNVTINNPPALSANPTLTQTCEGSKIQLFATGSGDFVWNGPATYTSNQQNPVINNIPVHLSGTYTVALTASTGCVSNASVEVKVYDQIHAIATASADTICEGQSLQLHAEGGTTYLWNGPAGFNSNESDPRIDFITAKHSGKYYVYISNEGGCYGYAELTVFVKPAAKGSAYAAPNPVLENNQVQFFASSTGVAYSWSGPLGFTSTQQNPSIKKVTRFMAGIYTVTITNENECPTVVKVNLRVLFTNKGGQTITGDDGAISTRSEKSGMVYPNPTSGFLYFETESNEAIEYMIYDMNGKIISRVTSVDKNYISTEDLNSGVYHIRWKAKDQKDWIDSRFVKIR